MTKLKSNSNQLNMSKENEKKWNELARNGVLCSQPKLELIPKEAKAYINKNGFYQESFTGKDILCLAAGGGQQSIAFALLGGNVTVVDFSEEQLERDKIVAQKYQQKMRIVKADMRDLSFCKDEEFDIVYQPYSINYIPSIEKVFDEVSRILKPNGLYDLMFHNPYVHGSWKDGCWEKEWKPEELWEGKGYPIWQPYQDGYPIQTKDGNWNFKNSVNKFITIESPQEYRHTMSTIMNGLITRGLAIINYQEEVGSAYEGQPGTWEHYKTCLPPWIYLLSKKKELE